MVEKVTAGEAAASTCEAGFGKLVYAQMRALRLKETKPLREARYTQRYLVRMRRNFLGELFKRKRK